MTEYKQRYSRKRVVPTRGSFAKVYMLGENKGAGADLLWSDRTCNVVDTLG